MTDAYTNDADSEPTDEMVEAAAVILRDDTAQRSSNRDTAAAILRAALAARPVPATTVEIGGQVMTEAQFDAARFPLLSPDPGPAAQEHGDEAINVIFDGPPAHKSGRFIEVETDDGRGISAGQWIKDDRHAGWWKLRITSLPAASRGVEGKQT